MKETRKRIKHVYDSGEVFHILFHRPEGLDYCKNPQGNQSWTYNKETNFGRCYSYGTEIALVNFDKKIIHFRNATYTNTTRKHQSRFYGAIPDKETWTIVSYDSSWNHYGDIEYWAAEKKTVIIDSLKKLRGSPRKYLNEYSWYVNFLDGCYSTLSKLNRLDLYEAYFSNEALKEYAWCEKDTLTYNIKTWCNNYNVKGSFKKKTEYYSDPILKKMCEDKYVSDEKEKENKKLEKQKENLNKWLNNIPGWYQLYSIPIHLRLTSSGDIETTLGVKVPLIEAQLLYKKFTKCKETNTNWKQNGERFKIGQYQVERIYFDSAEKEWCLKAGCHWIRNTEIEKFIEMFKPEWKDE